MQLPGENVSYNNIQFSKLNRPAAWHMDITCSKMGHLSSLIWATSFVCDRGMDSSQQQGALGVCWVGMYLQKALGAEPEGSTLLLGLFCQEANRVQIYWQCWYFCHDNFFKTRWLLWQRGISMKELLSCSKIGSSKMFLSGFLVISF